MKLFCFHISENDCRKGIVEAEDFFEKLSNHYTSEQICLELIHLNHLNRARSEIENLEQQS